MKVIAHVTIGVDSRSRVNATDSACIKMHEFNFIHCQVSLSQVNSKASAVIGNTWR